MHPRMGISCAASYSSTVGVSLSDDEMESVVQDAVVWANQHGLVRGPRDMRLRVMHGPAPHGLVAGVRSTIDWGSLMQMR